MNKKEIQMQFTKLNIAIQELGKTISKLSIAMQVLEDKGLLKPEEMRAALAAAREKKDNKGNNGNKK